MDGFAFGLAADFRYFVLNLPARNGTNVNYRVNLNTCASLATDPDMCVGTEYFDDGGSSNSQGACVSRPAAVQQLRHYSRPFPNFPRSFKLNNTPHASRAVIYLVPMLIVC